MYNLTSTTLKTMTRLHSFCTFFTTTNSCLWTWDCSLRTKQVNASSCLSPLQLLNVDVCRRVAIFRRCDVTLLRFCDFARGALVLWRQHVTQLAQRVVAQLGHKSSRRLRLGLLFFTWNPAFISAANSLLCAFPQNLTATCVGCCGALLARSNLDALLSLLTPI